MIGQIFLGVFLAGVALKLFEWFVVATVRTWQQEQKEEQNKRNER